MTGLEAESDLPNLQYFLWVSQVGKRQSSAKESRNTLVHRVEPTKPSPFGDGAFKVRESHKNAPLLFVRVCFGGL